MKSHTADGIVQAVRGVSFWVDKDRTLGIVGESGPGKTFCTRTPMGLTPGARANGEALFDGVDPLTSERPSCGRCAGPGSPRSSRTR